MSGRARAICCRWTPSALRALAGPVTRSPAIATAPAPRRRARVGWEFCHSIIDDHSRLVYTEIHADETRRHRHRLRRARAAVLRRPRHPARGGCRPITRWTYIHNRWPARAARTNAAIQHRRIPPRTPKRNGKIERYQQTLAREWAYGQRYRSSTARAAALPDLAHPLQHHQTPQLDRQPAAHQPIPVRKRPEAQHLAGEDVRVACRRCSYSSSATARRARAGLSLVPEAVA